MGVIELLVIPLFATVLTLLLTALALLARPGKRPDPAAAARSPKALVEQAEAQLAAQDFSQAEAVFRELLDQRALSREEEDRAVFGLANALLGQGQSSEAEAHFRSSHSRGHRRRSSLLALARLRREQDPELAASLQERARASSDSVASDESNPFTSLLGADDSETSRRIVAALHSLRFRRRVRVAACLPQAARLSLCLTVALACLAASAEGVSGPGGVPVALAACVLLLLWSIRLARRYADQLSSEYELRDGVIIRRYGIFSRNLAMLEVFRVHNVHIRRPLLNLLTGDGTLTVIGEKETHQPTMALLGIARGAELESLLFSLRDLSRLLRSSGIIKGIVK